MRVKKLGVLLLMAAIFAGSMLAIGCDAIEDAIKSGKDVKELVEYFNDIEFPSSASDLADKAYYFPEPFYAYKTTVENDEEQVKGEYEIIDVVGASKVRKYSPIKIYFDDYIDFKTFKKANVSLKDASGDEVPGLYLLTFRWKQIPGGDFRIKKASDITDKIDDFKKIDIPKQSMILIIPFTKITSKVTLSFDGEEVLDVGGNELKGAPVTKNETPTELPKEGDEKPGTTKPDTTKKQCTIEGEADTTEPADAKSPGDRIRIGDGSTFNVTYDGNAGLIDITTVFPDANQRPNFGSDEFGSEAALLTTGDVYYYVDNTNNFCDTDGNGQDDDKYSIDGKSSSMTLNIKLGSEKKLKFDYFFISAEVDEWCSATTNYNDEVVVTIAPTDGQPIVTTIETQAQYADVKGDLDDTYELNVGKELIDDDDTSVTNGFDNYTHDGTFCVCADADAIENDEVFDAKTAEFDLSDFSGDIVLTIDISDVGDSWNTSMIVVDNIRFE
jgi:hypothetical protein